MNDLKRLIKIMPPPAHHVGAIGKWRQAEKIMGTRLPDDYKRFIEAYGTGSIGRMPIYVSNAFTSDMKECCAVGTKSYQTLFAESPELLPYPLYPETGGLLCWGSTDNGDSLHWLTKGSPNHWSIMVHDFGEMEFRLFETNFIGFILNIVTQRYDIFPKIFFDPPVIFFPSTGTG